MSTFLLIAGRELFSENIFIEKTQIGAKRGPVVSTIVTVTRFAKERRRKSGKLMISCGPDRRGFGTYAL